MPLVRDPIAEPARELAETRARLVDAADRARRELERELHHGAQPRLVAVALRLQAWLARHPEVPEAARAEIAALLDEQRAGLAELRRLAHELYPAVINEHGLRDALTALAHRTPASVDLVVDVAPERLDERVETTTYRVVCAALESVPEHGRARVHVAAAGDRLEIRADGADPGDLQELRDRVAAGGGTLELSSRPGAGTTLTARLPLRGEAVPESP